MCRVRFRWVANENPHTSHRKRGGIAGGVGGAGGAGGAGVVVVASGFESLFPAAGGVQQEVEVEVELPGCS